MDDCESRIFQIVNNFSSSSLIMKTDFIICSGLETRKIEFLQVNETTLWYWSDGLIATRIIISSSEDDSMNLKIFKIISV